MISIRGYWYDGKSSAQTAAVLNIYDNGALRLRRSDTGEILITMSAFKADVSPRLANTPRYLRFDGNSTFETQENDAVDAALAKIGRAPWTRMLHTLESRKRYILLSGVLLIAVIAVMINYGIPFAAQVISRHLPDSFYRQADRQTLAILDKTFFSSSELDPQVESRVRDHFNTLIQEHPQTQIRILFRKGDENIGPNAFALPHGTVIFTDQMVEISENDDELLSVLAHEVGHVVHRHGMRSIVQDSILSFMLLAITGDTSGTSELFLGLPVFFTEMSYSRSFETEADVYALNYLRDHRIPTAYFADLLLRIETRDDTGKRSSHEGWRSYLSTHPNTTERLKKFEQE